MKRLPLFHKAFTATAAAAVAAILFCLGLNSGCKSAPKKTTPELSQYNGKKVALVAFEGETLARQIVEVSLVNQLISEGSFFLIPRQDVQEAMAFPDIKPDDWELIAKRAGADIALRIKTLEFEAQTHEGYSKEEVEDSQWEKERGEKKLKNLYKVKSMDGIVRIELQFTDLKTEETRSAIAEHRDHIEADSRFGAPYLKPKLSFLESITQEAFRKFFKEFGK